MRRGIAIARANSCIKINKSTHIQEQVSGLLGSEDSGLQQQCSRVSTARARDWDGGDGRALRAE